MGGPAFQSPASYFHRYKDLPMDQAKDVARKIWQEINLPNLITNIQPTRDRARLVLQMGRSHTMEKVWLRRV